MLVKLSTNIPFGNPLSNLLQGIKHCRVSGSSISRMDGLLVDLYVVLGALISLASALRLRTLIRVHV